MFVLHPSLKPVIWQLSREGHHRSRPSGIALAPPPPRALGGRLHHRSEIPMTRDETMGLKPLDIIRPKTNADAFIVHRVSVAMLREGMAVTRTEEYKSELPYPIRNSSAGFCLKKKKQ